MKNEITSYIKLLLKYLKHLKFHAILLGSILAISVALQLIMPRILGSFIDKAVNGASVIALIYEALAFIGAAIFQQLLSLTSTYASQVVGWNTTNELRIDLIEKALSLDMNFHKSHKPGEMLERIDGDVKTLFNFFSKLLPNILNSVVLIIGILVMLFRESMLIGIPISIFVLLALFVFTYIQKKAVSVYIENRRVTTEFYGLLGENIHNREDIRSLGAVGYFIYCYHSFLRKFYAIQLRSELMFYRMVASSLVLFAMGGALSLGVGGYLWTKGLISLGTVYMIFNYTELLRRPIDQIRFQLEDLQKAGASIERIEELFTLKSKLIDGVEELSCVGAFSINVRNISFQYEDGNQVLREISFKVPKGKIIGILGRTGSGKTTLARLIARLYDPQGGEVLFDERGINKLKLQSLRKQVAYVTQDVQIFCATVRDNITLFNTDIKDEHILNIIDDIGLKIWYKRLPQGLDTMIGADGLGLSAGEAQLLAFIRVFLKQPGLVILDEASSRLDPATEKLMEKPLKKLLENRTCIIIAHRLSTVEIADDILILENGAIIEYGNREDLLHDKDSKFYKLLEKGIEEVLV